MLAVVNFAPQPLSVELREVPLPAIGDDDVLLDVQAVSVCGSDLHQYHGKQSWKVNYPVVLGHEFAGRIALFGRGRVPAPRLCVIDVAAHPASVHQGEGCLCRRKALLGSEATPAQGFGMIGRDRDPVRKHQLAIAVGNVLIDRGGMIVPARRPAIGLAAMEMGKAQLVLRLAMALLRRPPEPYDSIAKAADDPFAPRG